MTDFAITVKRGDTIDLEVTAARDGSPVDLTSADLWCTGKRKLKDADEDAIFQKTLGDGIVLIDPEEGTALVTIDPADTAVLTKQTTVYTDIQMIEASGRVTTIASGTLTVELDATVTTA